MSNGMIGAAPDELDQTATFFRESAGKLDDIHTELTARLHNSPWSGADAVDFTSQWSATVGPRVLAVCKQLNDGADTLSRNAEEQRRASGVSGSSGALRGFVSREPAGGKSGDPFDGKHTQAEVRKFLRDKYIDSIVAVRGSLVQYVTEKALESNPDGRRHRQNEGWFGVSRLYADLRSQNYTKGFPELTAMDTFAINKVMPWADVQAIQMIGGDDTHITGDGAGSPIFLVAVSRLPSLEGDADAVTIGHYIFVDVDSEDVEFTRNEWGGTVELSEDGLYHELTHLHRAQLGAVIEDGHVDDHSWYITYGLQNQEEEEAIAYQVGWDDDYGPNHVVTGG